MSSTTDRRRRRSQRGQILVIFAGGFVLVCAIAALVFDVGQNLLDRRAEQNASDAAALAGARYLPGSSYVYHGLFRPSCMPPVAAACEVAAATATSTASADGPSASTSRRSRRPPRPASRSTSRCPSGPPARRSSPGSSGSAAADRGDGGRHQRQRHRPAVLAAGPRPDRLRHEQDQRFARDGGDHEQHRPYRLELFDRPAPCSSAATACSRRRNATSSAGSSPRAGPRTCARRRRQASSSRATHSVTCRRRPSPACRSPSSRWARRRADPGRLPGFHHALDGRGARDVCFHGRPGLGQGVPALPRELSRWHPDQQVDPVPPRASIGSAAAACTSSPTARSSARSGRRHGYGAVRRGPDLQHRGPAPDYRLHRCGRPRADRSTAAAHPRPLALKPIQTGLE